jgi:sugar lactone lactonase YvrE
MSELSRRRILAAAFAAPLAAVPPQETLFQAEPLTPPRAFTPGIEGPQCDRQGYLYAVNYQKQQTIARVAPDGSTELFLTLPNQSTGNGIVFDRLGRMYIADYVEHNVLRVDMASRSISVYCHEPAMNQPNDLAIRSDGTLYASDPAWKRGDGKLWRIGTDGKAALLGEGLGTTNGIEVSPDEKTLYVNESVQRKVWAFPLRPDGGVGERRLLRAFTDGSFDGMRCDIDGNLYITRTELGKVIKMSPSGEILREIDVLGNGPTNLCFGGTDGRTVYVTEREYGRIVKFRVDRPGLAWLRWRKAPHSSP